MRYLLQTNHAHETGLCQTAISNETFPSQLTGLQLLLSKGARVPPASLSVRCLYWVSCACVYRNDWVADVVAVAWEPRDESHCYGRQGARPCCQVYACQLARLKPLGALWTVGWCDCKE